MPEKIIPSFAQLHRNNTIEEITQNIRLLHAEHQSIIDHVNTRLHELMDD